ncbi:hypothetical protein SLS60_003761 [Paraconiothyrium brasiliense]|uniref:RING-type domain-containing protein n=1 Tax=Paraconiothyrium brasiliense TaxID=300254 RepID=A0ABR3RQF2_9PLEO
MATCSSCLNSKFECLEETCPDRLLDSDSDVSESDSESCDPIFPSTLPGFDSDLECFDKIFPSLFNALEHNHEEFPQNQSHLLNLALMERYCRPSDEWDEWEIPPPKSILRCIKSEELLNFFDLIHATVEVKHVSRSAAPLTDAQVEVKIQAKSELFSTMLDNAIKELIGFNEDSGEMDYEEFYLVRWGWRAARDGEWTYPYWVYGPADVHNPVQLEPDSTPIEYKATGDPVPLSVFSLPYQGPYPAQGTCIICMHDFADNDRELVVARCPTGHLFHGQCLNFWVNDSAMGNANMCPHDRQRLCDPRPRIHRSVLPDGFDADESVQDDDTDMDADESDQEDEEFDIDIDKENEDPGCAEEFGDAASLQVQQTVQDSVH